MKLTKLWSLESCDGHNVPSLQQGLRYILPYDEIEREREENIICCPWDTEEVDYPWETEDAPYIRDNIEDIYPPLWSHIETNLGM